LGTVTLPNSQVNITYQLKSGTTAVQTAKAGTGSALVWTGVAGSASPGTAYTVVGTRNGTGCSSTSGPVSVIAKPLPTLSPDNKSVCQGGSVTLTAIPTGGTWSGNGVSGSTFTSASGSNTLNTGNYTVTYSYTDGTTGCSNTANATVTVNARPSGPQVQYNPPGCSETTFSVQIVNPVVNTTYKLNGGTCTGCSITYTATGPTPVKFSGIAAGAGFSITATVGDCVSNPTTCSNYQPARVANPTPATEVPVALQSIQTEAYPNPTTKDATINFSVPKSGHVLVQVYNVLGAPVATLFDGEATAGEQRSVVLKGGTLAAGTYTYRVVANGKTKTNRVILDK
jgi:hypothetical protein